MDNINSKKILKENGFMTTILKTNASILFYYPATESYYINGT